MSHSKGLGSGFKLAQAWKPMTHHSGSIRPSLAGSSPPPPPVFPFGQISSKRPKPKGAEFIHLEGRFYAADPRVELLANTFASPVVTRTGGWKGFAAGTGPGPFV